jgi:hypothetical protein
MSITTLLLRWPEPPEDRAASSTFPNHNDLAVVSADCDGASVQAIVPLSTGLSFTHEGEAVFRLCFGDGHEPPLVPTVTRGDRSFSWASVEGRTLRLPSAQWLPALLSVPSAGSPAVRRARARLLTVDAGSDGRPARLDVESGAPLALRFAGPALILAGGGRADRVDGARHEGRR